MQVPKYVIETAKSLSRHGHEAWVVGGSVRDLIIGKPAYDYDIATDAHPEEVMGIFRRAIPTGIRHGTVTILKGGHQVEVTTFRSDGKYSDKRRPDNVTYASTIYEDLARRDFTINGIAYNPITGVRVDPYNGTGDIGKKIIRTIGDPVERFREDGLRPFRACRFAAQLEFTIEQNTFLAISHCLDTTSEISMERIRDEFLKILGSRQPSIGIDLMRKCGLLEQVAPELLTGLGVKQNRFHRYDIYYHNLYSCDAAFPEDYRIRLAALFHDIGKYHVKKDTQEGQSVFYNHEIIGAGITKRVMRRMKFSNSDIRTVVHLIRNHMFHYTRQWTDGAVRRFIRKVGLENLEALFELRRADRIGNGLKRGESNAVRNLKERIEKVLEAENAITVKDLAVNGHDIMREFNLEPGPIIGRILSQLLEEILDDPEKNTPETLISIARQIVAEEKKEAPTV
jgi:tRNA nucleotidyltransferase (CCA-adding enzyme)